MSVLYKRFGFGQMEMAEDIASDTFLTAVQTWPLNGIPENPAAWLYNVAKHKAINQLHRNAIFEGKVLRAIKNVGSHSAEMDIDLSEKNIRDSQLQMMFAICHPSIPAEAQIGLSLRILCGFGIEEIADAFLTNKETVNKRLFRAKEKLRDERISIAMPPPDEIALRLDNVLTTLYLLFSEGYYSVSQQATIRKELCLEAMRLCHMLVEHDVTNTREVNALLALMYFQASRLDARLNSNGELILYDDQDTSRWNGDMISNGIYFLHCATGGDTLSRYHLEATIAYWNTRKDDTVEKWLTVLELYDRLLQLQYSPVAALNRTYALSKVKGKKAAIDVAEKLDLTNNHFYYTLLGELYSGIDNNQAKENFEKALLLAKTSTDKHTIQKKIAGLPQ